MTLANQAISRFANAPNVLAKSPVPAHAYLTPRESLILADVVEGHSSKEIARALDLSPRTGIGHAVRDESDERLAQAKLQFGFFSDARNGS
jgi:FixJ family two-component response regulator